MREGQLCRQPPVLTRFGIAEHHVLEIGLRKRHCPRQRHRNVIERPRRAFAAISTAAEFVSLINAPSADEIGATTRITGNAEHILSGAISGEIAP